MRTREKIEREQFQNIGNIREEIYNLRLLIEIALDIRDLLSKDS